MARRAAAVQPLFAVLDAGWRAPRPTLGSPSRPRGSAARRLSPSSDLPFAGLCVKKETSQKTERALMDSAITQWINAPAGGNALLDLLGTAVTRFGVPVMVLLVVLQWWSAVERRHVRHAAIAAGLSFLIGLGLNQLVLLLVHRMRPYDAGLTRLIVERSGDWSFPSDHATAACAIAAAFALQRLRGRALFFLACALLIAWSRVYVGTHYVSDILGGATTGVIGAGLVRALYREGTRLDRFATEIL
jgi:undecaprenyl-diphosphatase